MKASHLFPLSTLLQRTFCVSKWVVGLGAWTIGWVGSVGSSSNGTSLAAWGFCLAFFYYQERALLEWSWVGAREDREDPPGALPLESWDVAVRFFVNRTVFYMTLLLVPCFLPALWRNAELGRVVFGVLCAFLKMLAWAAFLGPGLPPSERVLFRLNREAECPQ